MTDRTPAEAQQAILNDVTDGASEKRVGDRSKKMEDPLKRYEVMRKIAADQTSPFIRRRMAGRNY